MNQKDNLSMTMSQSILTYEKKKKLIIKLYLIKYILFVKKGEKMANHKEDKDHSQVEEHILKRFDLQEYKGKGAYGIVWKAYDRKTKQIVALKKVNLFYYSL